MLEPGDGAGRTAWRRRGRRRAGGRHSRLVSAAMLLSHTPSSAPRPCPLARTRDAMHRRLKIQTALAYVAVAHTCTTTCGQLLHDDFSLPQHSPTSGITVPPVPESLEYFGYYAVMRGGEDSFAFSNFVFDWPTNVNATILSRDAGHNL